MYLLRCRRHRGRQQSRKDLVSDGDGSAIPDAAGGGWQKSADEMDAFLDSFVEKGPPEETDFSFVWQRAHFRNKWRFDKAEGIWRLHNRRTYTLPDRFSQVF